MAESIISHSEMGSNSYGQYVLLEDGTLIEWGRCPVTIPGNSQAEYQIQFPKPFRGYPTLTITTEIYSLASAFACLVRSISTYNSTIRVSTSAPDEQQVTINWIAIGKAA